MYNNVYQPVGRIKKSMNFFFHVFAWYYSLHKTFRPKGLGWRFWAEGCGLLHKCCINVAVKFALFYFCIQRVTQVNTHHHNSLITMSKSKPKKSLGLGREHKDITCAVRVPPTMYNQLCEVAKAENSSISDVIRSSLIARIEMFNDKAMEKQLKEARLEAELRKLREA